MTDSETPPPPDPNANGDATPVPVEAEHLPEKREPAPSWEVVLSRAGGPMVPAGASRARRAASPAGAITWVKAALPLLVLVAFIGYKISQREAPPPRTPEMERAPSLTGVRPEAPSLRTDRQLEEFIARLERQFQAEDWAAIGGTITAAPESHRAHPLVEAFDLIARVKQGERNGILRARLRASQRLLETDRARRPMYEMLLLCEAELVLKVTTSPEAAMRNADLFRTALRQQSRNTPASNALRTRLAERYGRIAAEVAAESGRFRVDRRKLADARSLYQHALRWVTTEDGWLVLQPISTGNASTIVNRLRVELIEQNKRFHGRSMPFTRSDSTTWSGRRDEPINDHPGGTW